MKENMKAETARAEALARAEAERMNEDVKLRMMKAEAEQRRIRNVAAVKETFEWIGKGFNQVRMRGTKARHIKHCSDPFRSPPVLAKPEGRVDCGRIL